MDLIFLFIASAVINNYVLTYFLGICPFIGVSRQLDTATSMGLAVIFVMTLTAAFTWPINHLVLAPYGLPFLKYVTFILVIAALVQLVEMFIRKTSQPLYLALGIYLPLITTNCAILGLALFMDLREYSFVQSLVFAIGAGLGFTIALVIMAGIREELAFARVPRALDGPGITLIVAGLLALAFMGFAGLGGTG